MQKIKITTKTTIKTVAVLEFEEFLTSGLNQLMKVDEQLLTQDMTQPLTHYYIASSHNTYLEGHQLIGISSAEQYIRVLKLGCKCIELDCWDGEDGEPMIYHGHTVVTRVKFEIVIIAINNYAFYTSPYPVTLSLEDHCCVEQQDKMTDIMQKIFGDKLIYASERPNTDHPGFLPSPEFLKYKIILKGKAIGEIKEEDHEVKEQDPDQIEPPKPEKISEKLSLATYLKSRPFKTYEDSKSAQPWEISSISEPKNRKNVINLKRRICYTLYEATC